MFIPDPGFWLWIFPIPDPEVKKAPDPGSPTLFNMVLQNSICNIFRLLDMLALI
jgi:hypothetical protein